MCVPACACSRAAWKSFFAEGCYSSPSPLFQRFRIPALVWIVASCMWSTEYIKTHFVAWWNIVLAYVHIYLILNLSSRKQPLIYYNYDLLKVKTLSERWGEFVIESWKSVLVEHSWRPYWVLQISDIDLGTWNFETPHCEDMTQVNHRNLFLFSEP